MGQDASAPHGHLDAPWKANKFHVWGIISRDPELAVGANGVLYTRFFLRTPGRKDNQWFPLECVAVHESAERMADQCRKGDILDIRGRIIAYMGRTVLCAFRFSVMGHVERREFKAIRRAAKAEHEIEDLLTEEADQPQYVVDGEARPTAASGRRGAGDDAPALEIGPSPPS